MLPTFGILRPPISRERLQLETSNLAQRWMAVCTNEKMQNWVKRGHVGLTWPTFGILGPPISRERLNLETSKLAQRRMTVSTNEKCKLRSCGSHMTHFWNFGTTLISWGWLELETSNLAQIWTTWVLRKKYKIRSKGVMWGSRDSLLQFWDPLYLGSGWS